MRSTIVGRGGRRIVVQASKSSVGGVQLEIVTSDRAVAAIMTLDAECVGALVLGFERAAIEAKNKQDCFMAEYSGHIAKYLEKKNPDSFGSKFSGRGEGEFISLTVLGGA